MNMTLHLTDACNLRCRYCYQTRSPERMSEETARKAIDLSRGGGEGVLSKGDTAHTGICFFGGEPLLMRGLVEKTVAYAKEIHGKTGHEFYFRLVTNGILLDESFLEFAAENRIGIGFSHDGLMQDDARIFPDGHGGDSGGENSASTKVFAGYDGDVYGVSVVGRQVRRFC